MIIRTGIDIIEIERINKIYIKYKEKFLQRILTPNEISMCSYNNTINISKVAKRFAAKEALAKALGTGIGASLSFLDIDITANQMKMPFIIINDKIRKIIKENLQVNNFDLSLSLTDEKNIAIANVILIGY